MIGGVAGKDDKGRTFADLEEAKLYVYAVMGAATDNELNDPEGWIFGGVTDPLAKGLAREAAIRVRDELLRKSGQSVPKRRRKR